MVRKRFFLRAGSFNILGDRDHEKIAHSGYDGPVFNKVLNECVQRIENELNTEVKVIESTSGDRGSVIALYRFDAEYDRLTNKVLTKYGGMSVAKQVENKRLHIGKL